MSMKTGLKPTPVDARDKHFSFHRLFGTAANFPDSYIVDSGFLPDQNADSRPSECTGYTIADLCATEDGVEYSPDFNYMETLEIQNLPPDTQGADARTAFRVPCSLGLLPKSLQPNFASQTIAATSGNYSPVLYTQARSNIKSGYFPIAPVPDYFDGIRSALLLGQSERKVVGMATQWSPSFELVGPDSTLTENPQTLYWGHMYEACGWKTINGAPYLILKTWQGRNYGDRGYVYMSRTLCNFMMGAWGTYAASIEKLPANTIAALKSRQADLVSTALALAENLLGQLMYKLKLA